MISRVFSVHRWEKRKWWRTGRVPAARVEAQLAWDAAEASEAQASELVHKLMIDATQGMQRRLTAAADATSEAAAAARAVSGAADWGAFCQTTRQKAPFLDGAAPAAPLLPNMAQVEKMGWLQRRVAGLLGASWTEEQVRRVSLQVRAQLRRSRNAKGARGGSRQASARTARCQQKPASASPCLHTARSQQSVSAANRCSSASQRSSGPRQRRRHSPRAQAHGSVARHASSSSPAQASRQHEAARHPAGLQASTGS